MLISAITEKEGRRKGEEKRERSRCPQSAYRSNQGYEPWLCIRFVQMTGRRVIGGWMLGTCTYVGTSMLLCCIIYRYYRNSYSFVMDPVDLSVARPARRCRLQRPPSPLPSRCPPFPFPASERSPFLPPLVFTRAHRQIYRCLADLHVHVPTGTVHVFHVMRSTCATT